MNMKKVLALIIAVIMALSLAACGGGGDTSGESGGDEAGNKKITIAFCTWAGYAPLFIAQEKGYFEEYGYEADIQIIEDESTYGSLFSSGSIQALGQVLDRDLVQFAAGAPEAYVCTMDASTGGDGLVAAAGIDSVDDLKGKKVALDKSATSYYFFMQVLSDSSITEEDVEIVDMGNDEAGEALLAGNVDAAVTWEPILSQCADQGKLLASSKDYNKTIIDILTVSTAFAEENPDVYDVLKDCWNRSVDYLNENFDEGCEIMAAGLDLEAEEVKEECAGITFYDKAMNEEFADTSKEGNVFETAKSMAAFWKEKGEMDAEEDAIKAFFPTLGL